MTRCRGFALFKCLKRDERIADYCCPECSARRIPLELIRFSNYFVFLGEQGSHICPGIAVHKFMFVTNHLHMIVFKTAREAVVASDKVNARRGPRYGLYAAETIFGDAVNQLAEGVPLVLNKHYHRLVPDPDVFRGIHIVDLYPKYPPAGVKPQDHHPPPELPTYGSDDGHHDSAAAAAAAARRASFSLAHLGNIHYPTATFPSAGHHHHHHGAIGGAANPFAQFAMQAHHHAAAAHHAALQRSPSMPTGLLTTGQIDPRRSRAQYETKLGENLEKSPAKRRRMSGPITQPQPTLFPGVGASGGAFQHPRVQSDHPLHFFYPPGTAGQQRLSVSQPAPGASASGESLEHLRALLAAQRMSSASPGSDANSTTTASTSHLRVDPSSGNGSASSTSPVSPTGSATTSGTSPSVSPSPAMVAAARTAARLAIPLPPGDLVGGGSYEQSLQPSIERRISAPPAPSLSPLSSLPYNLAAGLSASTSAANFLNLQQSASAAAGDLDSPRSILSPRQHLHKRPLGLATTNTEEALLSSFIRHAPSPISGTSGNIRLGSTSGGLFGNRTAVAHVNLAAPSSNMGNRTYRGHESDHSHSPSNERDQTPSHGEVTRSRSTSSHHSHHSGVGGGIDMPRTSASTPRNGVGANERNAPHIHRSHSHPVEPLHPQAQDTSSAMTIDIDLSPPVPAHQQSHSATSHGSVPSHHVPTAGSTPSTPNSYTSGENASRGHSLSTSMNVKEVKCFPLSPRKGTSNLSADYMMKTDARQTPPSLTPVPTRSPSPDHRMQTAKLFNGEHAW